MTHPMRLTLSLAGPDLLALLRMLADRVHGGAPPTEVGVDMKTEPVSPDWLDRWGAGFRRTLSAFYGGGTDDYLIVQRGRVLQASFEFPHDAGAVLGLLSELPFTVASLAPLFKEWEEREPP